MHAGSWSLSETLRVWETRSLPSETLNVPPRIYPQLHVRMRAARKFGQFVYDIFMPQGLLSLMATTSLLVPRGSLGERLAITLTSARPHGYISCQLQRAPSLHTQFTRPPCSHTRTLHTCTRSTACMWRGVSVRICVMHHSDIGWLACRRLQKHT